MAKVEKPKAPPKLKLTKKAQYERFKETARELGIDDEKNAEEFERTFTKIVPPKSKAKPRA
jgi:hypothetical protein